MTATTERPTVITPESHGPALHAAGVRRCLQMRAALAPFRGKDPGVDRYFAQIEAQERPDADRAAAPSAAADK